MNLRFFSILSILVCGVSIGLLSDVLFDTALGVKHYNYADSVLHIGLLRYCYRMYFISGPPSCTPYSSMDFQANQAAAYLFHSGASHIISGMQAGVLIAWIASILILLMHIINLWMRSRLLMLSIVLTQFVAVIGGLIGLAFVIVFVKEYPDVGRDPTAPTFDYSFFLLIAAITINIKAGIVSIYYYRKSSSSAYSAAPLLPSSSSASTDPSAAVPSPLSPPPPLTLIKTIAALEFLIFVFCVASLSDPSIGRSYVFASETIDRIVRTMVRTVADELDVGLFRACRQIKTTVTTLVSSQETDTGKQCDDINRNYYPTLQGAQAFGVLFALFAAFSAILSGLYLLVPSIRSNYSLLKGYFITVLLSLLWSILAIGMIGQLISDGSLYPGAAFYLFIIECGMQIVVVAFLADGYKGVLQAAEEGKQATTMINNNATGTIKNNYNNNNSNPAAINHQLYYPSLSAPLLKLSSSPSAPSPLFCSHCRVSNPPNARFCYQCGTRF